MHSASHLTNGGDDDLSGSSFVEDEPDLQIIYRDVLSREGFEVHLAGDGEAAHFDLMIHDFDRS